MAANAHRNRDLRPLVPRCCGSLQLAGIRLFFEFQQRNLQIVHVLEAPLRILPQTTGR